MLGAGSVASVTPHTLICDDETSRLVWYKSPGNNMLLRGISRVVLGYSRLDGGAARARVLYSLISQGTDLSHFCEKYIKCVHCISYVIVSGVCAWIAHMVFMSLLISSLFVESLEGPVSEVSGSSRIAREVSRVAGRSGEGKEREYDYMSGNLNHTMGNHVLYSCK